jgi:hypothetical protein
MMVCISFRTIFFSLYTVIIYIDSFNRSRLHLVYEHVHTPFFLKETLDSYFYFNLKKYYIYIYIYIYIYNRPLEYNIYSEIKYNSHLNYFIEKEITYNIKHVI